METKMKQGIIGVYIGKRWREKRSEKQNEYWNDIRDSVGKDFGSQIMTPSHDTLPHGLHLLSFPYCLSAVPYPSPMLRI
jgi:hypothetical protein